MSGKQLIIKIQGERVYFNPAYAIDLRCTNIPYQHIQFRAKRDIYWRVEMTKYEPLVQGLFLKVLSYDDPDLNTFKSQIRKRDIAHITFESIDWGQIEPYLSFYDKGQIKKITDNPFDTQQQHDIRIDTSISLSEVLFKLGYVSFIKRIPEINRQVVFRIPNSYILPEFDCIKFWFSRVLKTKRIKVSATLKREYNTETVIAHSPEIDKINHELIDSIKIQRTYGLMKKPALLAPDKSLFTSDDIFDQFKEETNNVFRQKDLDILQILSDSGKIRNRKQLEYLSGLKQSANNKKIYPPSKFWFPVFSRRRTIQSFCLGNGQLKRNLYMEPGEIRGGHTPAIPTNRRCDQ
ncbi:MAG: hypothetical protein JWO03_280 [Bacteroidetes bacterium]|nr:hypothetical protein [Bacteroidota bacterium]